MHRIVLRFVVALVSFIAGVSLTSLWKSLRETSHQAQATSVLMSAERVECIPDESSSTSEDELRQIYDQYAEAQTNHDAAFFEQNEAEDFILFQPYGKNLSRTQDIELLNSQNPEVKYSIDDLHMQLYGDAAIVTGRMRATYSSGGSYSWPWIDVCVRRNGRWQILSTTQLN